MPAPIKVFKSLVAQPSMAGGEREPMGIVVGGAILMFAMAWQFLSILCLVVGLILLTVGMYLVQRIYKRDPMMFAIYRRHLPYRAFYPAKSTAFRRK
jgi:type IV secretory pathway TrbD component